MSRFFIDKKQIQGNRVLITNASDIKHITKVLRLDSGDKLEISDSEQFEYSAVIDTVSQDAVECVITDKQRFLREPAIKVTLFQGIPKQGKMEVIVQKCVELGIMGVVPVFTSRTVIVDKGNFHKKIERWQKVADEAVKQCRRGVIPSVSDAVSFKEMTDSFENTISAFDLVIFLYENETGTTIKQVLQEFKTRCSKTEPEIAIIIGPEGGFSDEEAAKITSAGAKSASLGKTVLRTETAGAAALAMIMYELEL